MDDIRMQENAQGNSFEYRQAVWMVAAGALLGVAIDILFYGERLGISFPIWAVLSIGAVLFTSNKADTFPPRVFLIPVAIVLHAAFVAIRLEPMSVALNIAAVLVLFAIWLRDYHKGGWLTFGWLRVLWAVVSVPVEMTFRPWRVLGQVTSRAAGDSRLRKTALAVLRGLLLAIPVLLVFSALLSAADLVFSDVMERLLAWFDIEWLQEAIRQLLLIFIAGLLSLGAIVTALRDQPSIDADAWLRRRTPRFLGKLETLIVLGAVNALFLLFVIIQFRYFFGGESNITTTGYTYAVYARRGFGELLTVAFLSLGLILGLNHWGRWEEARRWFKGFSALLVGEVAVMLVSAFRRLALYEAAYGFTRLRLYTHIAIIWLGIALTAFLVLLMLDRTHRTVLLAAVVSSGFILTLNTVNVDALIVRRNHDRYRTSGALDTNYFLELTFDAVPAMVEIVDATDGEERALVLANLACQRTRLQLQAESAGWPSTHFSRLRAAAALDDIEDELAGYDVLQGDSGWIARWGQREMYCGWYWD